jgi:hypothetical protein
MKTENGTDPVPQDAKDFHVPPEQTADATRILQLLDEDERAPDAVRAEKWRQKLRALESLRLSGDLIEDAHRFFDAAQIDPHSLGEPYAGAYERADRETILEYFRQVDHGAGRSGASRDPVVAPYFTRLHAIVKEIIAAAQNPSR